MKLELNMVLFQSFFGLYFELKTTLIVTSKIEIVIWEKIWFSHSI